MLKDVGILQPARREFRCGVADNFAHLHALPPEPDWAGHSVKYDFWEAKRQSIYLIVQMLVWRKFRDMGMRRKLRSLVLSFSSDHLPLQSCRLKVSVWIHWTIWGSCHVSDCSEGVRLFLAEQTSVVASIQKLENQAEILSVKFHLQGKRHYQGQSK